MKMRESEMHGNACKVKVADLKSDLNVFKALLNETCIYVNAICNGRWENEMRCKCECVYITCICECEWRITCKICYEVETCMETCIYSCKCECVYEDVNETMEVR